ncbi:unnamed protein product [Lampetra fluviatilis]
MTSSEAAPSCPAPAVTSQRRGGVSTHVLDTSRGRPASGLHVTLECSGIVVYANMTPWYGYRVPGCDLWLGPNPTFLRVTNEDGRCTGLLKGAEPRAGLHRLHFDTAPYWETCGLQSFYPYVEVVFTVSGPGLHLHVPLLLSPYSYCTYRGT